MGNCTMTTHAEDPIFSVASNGDTILLARQSGIYRSRDGGGIWQLINSEAFPTCVALIERTHLLVAGLPGGIARSSDDGESWRVAYLGVPHPVVVAISEGEGDTIFAATMEDGVFRSTDGGVSWRSVNVGLWLPRMTAILALGSESVAASTDVGVVLSTNAGLSWKDVLATNDPVSALAGKEQLVVAGTETGKILASRNGGASWTSPGAVPGGSTILELGLVGEDIVVLTEAGLYQVMISEGDELGSFQLRMTGDFVTGCPSADGTFVVATTVGAVGVATQS